MGRKCDNKDGELNENIQSLGDITKVRVSWASKDLKP